MAAAVADMAPLAREQHAPARSGGAARFLYARVVDAWGRMSQDCELLADWGVEEHHCVSHDITCV
eukprot:7333279-Prymnesium_polylepis.1